MSNGRAGGQPIDKAHVPHVKARVWGWINSQAKEEVLGQPFHILDAGFQVLSIITIIPLLKHAMRSEHSGCLLPEPRKETV